jgi:hypothetical protein
MVLRTPPPPGVTRLPEPTGLLETHLSVGYLGRSIAFYRDVDEEAERAAVL